MGLRWADIEPYVAVLADGGFQRGFAVRPGQRQFIAAEVSTHKFVKFGEFDYYKNAESIWIGTMQKWVVGSVWLVSDESEGIYVFYNFMNTNGYLTLLGKLRDDCLLYGLANEKFTELLNSIM